MIRRLREPWTDRQASRRLGVVACLVLAVIVLMVVFVAVRAWPTLVHNSGIAWLGPGGSTDKQLNGMIATSRHPAASVYHLRAWPLLYGTLLVSALAVAIGLVFSLFSAIFIVEFAPARLRRITIPAVRLLAAVPSVVYGLIGVLVLVPFLGNHVISQGRKQSVAFVVELTGSSVLVAVIVLTVMITPIMIAMIVDALRAVPVAWSEGAAALGANRWEALWTVSVRAARPAIVAAAVLACARALGEAVMIAMVAGGRAWAPNFLDGITALFEPVNTFASSIVGQSEAITSPAIRSTVYAFALLLLFSALMLSVAGYLAKLPMRRQGMRI
jgi:phosphate transport system permease protein